MVSSTLRDQEDFARAAYESIEDGVKLGNLKYREMFFNPTLHTRRGIPYKTVVDGLVDGVRASRARPRRHVPAHRGRLPAGCARDGARDGRAGARAPARRGDRARHGRRRGARSAGEVRRRVPAGEGGRATPDGARLRGRAGEEHHHLSGRPRRASGSTTATTCSATRASSKRTRDEGITFTVCPTATAVCYFDAGRLTKHPIRQMADEGLKIMLNSDDPPMFHTDIGTEYVGMVQAAEWGPERVRKFVHERGRRLMGLATTRSDRCGSDVRARARRAGRPARALSAAEESTSPRARTGRRARPGRLAACGAENGDDDEDDEASRRTGSSRGSSTGCRRR